MRSKNIKRLFIVGLISLTMFACKEDDKDDRVVDQRAFLENTSTIILSSYQVFDLSVELLDISIDSLTSNPSSANLTEARKNLKTAYLNWQRVSFFEFGPEETASLKSSLNVYKTDTAQIELNIVTGNYNLDQISMKSAKGFPALDYLIHGKLNSENLNQLAESESTRNYLKAVSGEIRSKVNQVTTAWASYQDDFKNASGTDVGSSTGTLVNQLNLHFEKFFRDNKVGVPLGVRSAGIAKPDFVESAFGQYSTELAIENFRAMKSLYLGSNGNGLDDYLVNSDAADLDNRIQSQIQLIEMKLNSLADPLANQIETAPNVVQEAYNEMQKLIVLWKVDMPSRMGVLITYQDNDGD